MKRITAFLFIIEAFYLILALTKVESFFTYIVACIATLIAPGMMILLFIKNEKPKITHLIVEGFFISTIIQATIPIIYLLVRIPINIVTISLVNFIICTLLIFGVWIANKDIDVIVRKDDLFLLIGNLSVIIFLLVFFYNAPRFFKPDETIYIDAARMFLNGQFPAPIGEPTRGFFYLVVWGKIVWFSFVAFFISATLLPPTYSGLLGLIFLFMLSLSPTLFFDETEKELLLASVSIIITNPLLISISATVLNDLALTFYTFLAITYFSKAFIKDPICKIKIKTKELVKSFFSIVFITVIKPNILFILPMWIVLLYVFFTYRNCEYKNSISFNIIRGVVLLPLLYELIIDFPYFLSYWIFKDIYFISLFEKFIIISPLGLFARIWVPPPTDPHARTMLSLPTIDYFDKFYRFITPEAAGLLIPVIILSSPLLLLILRNKKNVKIEQKYITLLIIVETSFWNFYLFVYSMFTPITRYSLWMVPLWIILSIKFIKLFFEKNQVAFLFVISLGEILLYELNLFISSVKGGVYIGVAPLGRVYTAPILLIIFVLSFMVYSFTLFLEKKYLTHLKRRFGHRKIPIITIKNIKKALFGLLIILIITSNIYFSYLLMQNSRFYTDHKFNLLNQALNEVTEKQPNLIFANNYLFMRTYIDNKLLHQGLFLPMPDTNSSLTTIINNAPQGTLFMITEDIDTAWYSYNDRYLTKYADSDVMTPETIKFEKLPNVTLPGSVLYMSFDNANESVVPDNSGLRNDGINHGAKVAEGYYGKTLDFNGSTYVSIENISAFKFNRSITISFYALIERAEPFKGHMIISKGHGYFNGSFSVFVYNTYIFFDLGGVGRLSFSALPYLNKWHHFVFIYNNQKLMGFVDGVLAGLTYGSGKIRETNFPLEIGRDSERGNYFFVGKIDELQISPIAINVTMLAKTYFESYAIKEKHITISTGNCTIFKLIHEKKEKEIIGKNRIVYIDPSLSVLSNTSVKLDIKFGLYGNKENITILVVDQRATKVFEVQLTPGDNVHSFIFSPEKYWASFWYYSRMIRIIIISHQNIIFNSIISLSNLKPIYVAILLILLFTLSGYMVVQSNWLKVIQEKMVNPKPK